jgi:hypothetical protein
LDISVIFSLFDFLNGILLAAAATAQLCPDKLHISVVESPTGSGKVIIPGFRGFGIDYLGNIYPAKLTTAFGTIVLFRVQPDGIVDDMFGAVSKPELEF